MKITNQCSMYGRLQEKRNIDNLTFTTTLSRAVVRTCIKEHLYVIERWNLYQNYIHILSRPPIELKQFNFRLIVAWLDNKPIGVMVMTGTDERECNLFVVPYYRRSGIATKLLTIASQFKEPNDLFCFTTTSANSPIIRLYKTFPEIRQSFLERVDNGNKKMFYYMPTIRIFKGCD